MDADFVRNAAPITVGRVRARWRRVGVALTGVALVAGCTGGSPAPPNAESSSVRAGAPTRQAPPASPSTPRPASRAPESGTSRAPVARTVSILGSGDVLIHPPVAAQARADAKAAGRTGFDFGPIFAGIGPVVRSADLATCELETPLAPAGGPFTGYPDFNAPPQVLTTLKAIGYDSCTTASNHTLDSGVAGVDRTLDELDQAGLKHTGSARSAKEAATPLIETMPNGVKVAQLAYTFGFNGNSLPAGKSWLANLTDVPTIIAAAHRAKQDGADIVVVSLHWGTEYDHLATALQKRQADELLASPDIDLILGDHAHVIQPMQRLHGKWVIYCMGNEIARHADPIDANREGVLPIFTFTETAAHRFTITRVEAVPIWVQLTPAIRLINLSSALRDPATSAANHTIYQRAYSEIKGYLGAYGAYRDGLTLPPG